MLTLCKFVAQIDTDRDPGMQFPLKLRSSLTSVIQGASLRYVVGHPHAYGTLFGLASQR
jgi:hypothetical protein